MGELPADAVRSLDELQLALQHSHGPVHRRDDPAGLCFPIAAIPEGRCFVTWPPKQRLILLALTTPVRLTDARHNAAVAQAVAQLNLGLPIPGFIFDADSGCVDFRLSLFADAAGRLDLELFGQLLAHAVATVQHHLPLLHACSTGGTTTGYDPQLAPQVLTALRGLAD